MPTTLEYVQSASSYPFSAIVSISVTYSSGHSTRGTGVVVGKNDVLTSAHVVDDSSQLGRVTSIEVTPGTTFGAEPFGRFMANHRIHKSYQITDDGTNSLAEVRNDYAILSVDGPPPIGDVTGWFGIRSNAVSANGTFLNMAGYPSGYQNGGPLDMVRASGTEYLRNGVIEHNYGAETGTSWAGASGSPYYLYTGGDRYVVGIHSTGSSATYIDGRVFDDLQLWMRQNDEQHLVGNGRDNRLSGGWKDDRLEGRGGADVLRGNDGEDRLFGGAGRDRLEGGRGDDALAGGGSSDRLFGGGGRDRITGDNGNDRIEGNAGRDRLFGGDGRDSLLGGGSGDLLRGGDQADVLRGGAGRDRLIGDRGPDVLVGGSGADRFIFGKGAGQDVIRDFQQGIDTIVIDTDINSFRDLRIRDAGPEVRILFGNNEVLVEDSRPGQFTASDFDFI